MLTFPVEPMLAAPVLDLPLPTALRGGSWYEPKFDGYRAVVFVEKDRARIQSRRGVDMTASFPDIAAAAAEQLKPGIVLDGELVIWANGRPDFAALQRRLAHRRNASELAASEPANLMVFDVLTTGGLDVRPLTLRARHGYLGRIASGMSPPLQVVPGTSDPDQARNWLEDYSRTHVGIEGLVIKGLRTPYLGGQRGWLKYKIRDTVEAVIGAVIGTPENAERLVLGYFDELDVLRIAGSTHALHPPHRLDLREHLFTAGADHPWPTELAAGGLGNWGGRDRIRLHRVEPTLVVEISADRALDHGRWRHLVRYVRLRMDVDARSITYGPGPSAAQ